MLLSCCLVEIFGQQEGRKNNQEDIFVGEISKVDLAKVLAKM